MPVIDHVCEMSIKRLYESRERKCELSFQRYLDDIQERLEIVDQPELWTKYRPYLEEKFEL